MSVSANYHPTPKDGARYLREGATEWLALGEHGDTVLSIHLSEGTADERRAFLASLRVAIDDAERALPQYG